jgi:pimeloyl-ACP methyl ester carboxylesterase
VLSDRFLGRRVRGHRRSERAPTGDCSLDRFGEDVEAVLSTCVPDGERAVVAGHSLGAMSIAAWAEQYAVQAPLRAAALLNTGIGDLIGGHVLVTLPRFAQWLNEPVAATPCSAPSLRSRPSRPRCTTRRFATSPSHARRIASVLPALTELIELPDTGHMGPLERPHEFSRALRELASIELGAPGSLAAA